MSKRKRTIFSVIVLAAVCGIAGLAALIIPPRNARADAITYEGISIAADTCVQISGTAVSRNSDGVSSSTPFTLRCPLDFLWNEQVAGDSDLLFLEGHSKGCWGGEFGSYIEFRVRRRAFASDSSPSSVASCEPTSSGATSCSDYASEDIDDNSYYYYLEIVHTGNDAIPCEAAGAYLEYRWTDDE